MSDRYPSEAADRFQVRLPDGLRERIKAHAECSGRSMNTEIVRALEEAFPAPPATIHLDEVVGLVFLFDVRTNDTIGRVMNHIKARTLVVPDIEDAMQAAQGDAPIYAHFDRIVTESGVVLKDKHAA